MFVFNKALESKLDHGLSFIEVIEKSFSSDGSIVSFVNPFSYSILNNNEWIINDVDYWYSDGALLCSLLNISRRDKIHRNSFDFSSVANELFLYATLHNYSISLIGGSLSEIQKASQYLSSRYPDMNIVYFRDGFFDDSEIFEIANAIQKSQADIVISGMGTPRQEEFLIEIHKKVNAKVLITCGGFFSQTAMRGDYYHPLVKKYGLRWLQRAIMHKHVRDRLLIDYPVFIVRYLSDLLINKLKNIKRL